MNEIKIVENSYGKFELTLDSNGKTTKTKILKIWVNNPPKRWKK